MPKMSYAKLTESWRALIAAARIHEAVLGEVNEQREALEQQLEKLNALKAMQISAIATRQRCTQQINEGIEEGQLMAIGLRGAVAAKLGPRNEQLVQFGKAPLRKRGRRTRPAAEGGAAAEPAATLSTSAIPATEAAEAAAAEPG